MGERSVQYFDNQELQAADLNNQQDFLTSSIDHIVLDSIEDGKAYTGLTLSKSATTTVSITPGRLYVAGKVYARDEIVTKDLFNVLPVVTKRRVAIVAWGQDVTNDIDSREFLTDAATLATEPRSLPMELTRFCALDRVSGVESSDPQDPVIDANTLLIGIVELDPTGIITITQTTSTQLVSLSALRGRTVTLETALNLIASAVGTLRTDLTNLANALKNYVPLVDYLKLVDKLTELWNLLHRPTTWIFYGTDNFLDNDFSDTAATGYDAIVQEGLRFAPGAAAEHATLELLNPFEPNAQVDDNFMIPTPAGQVCRLDATFPLLPFGSDTHTTYAYWTRTIRFLTRSRWRFRCGPRWLPCPPSAVWWYQSGRDPTGHILSYVTETWEPELWRDIGEHSPGPDWPRHVWWRGKYFWHDHVDQHHWSRVSFQHDHTGQVVSQVFLNSQDGWLTRATIYAAAGNFGALALLVCKCDDHGIPDLDQTIQRVLLDSTQSAAAFNRGVAQETFFNQGVYVGFPMSIEMPPTFIKGGERHALVLISAYNWFWSICTHVDAFRAIMGHYYYSGTNGWTMWEGATHKSLRFKLYYAFWARQRYTIQLEGLQLAGGIQSIEVLGEHIIPPACDVSYEVLIGGVWVPFGEDDKAPNLSSNPAVLQFRVVLSGTCDLMPGIGLGPRSEVTLARAGKSTLKHISKDIPLGSNSSAIKVVGRLLNFVEAHHDITATLKIGATTETADVVADVTNADGSTERTWTFNTAAPASHFVVVLDGATDGVGDNMVVAQRTAFAT